MSKDISFGKENLEGIKKRLGQEPFPTKVYTMQVNESGNGKESKISEASRKKCAKSLVNHFN